MDQAVVFHTWKNYRKILKKVRVLVLPRKGYFKKDIPCEYSNKFCFVKTRRYPACSTQIRKLIRSKRNVKKHLDSKVYGYIRKNNLYV